MANCESKLAKKYEEKYPRSRIKLIDEYAKKLERANLNAQQKWQEVKGLSEVEQVGQRAKVNSLVRLYKNSDFLIGDTYKDPGTALLSLWEGNPSLKANSYNSVENTLGTIRAKYSNHFTTYILHNNLVKVLADESLQVKVFDRYIKANRTGDVPKGGTGDAVDDATNLILKYNHALTGEQQKAGSSIMFNGERIISNMHDPDKILADVDAWIDFMLPRIDYVRSFGPGKIAHVNEVKAKLKIYAEEMKYNAESSSSGSKYMGGVRGIYFKDGQSAFDYNKTYGHGTLIAGLYASVEDAARKTALTQVFGDNPMAQYRKLKDLAAKAGADSTVLEKADAAMHYYSGRGFQSGDPTSMVRKIAYGTAKSAKLLTMMSKLGKSAGATLQDLPTIMVSLKSVDDRSILSHASNTFTSYLKALTPGERARVTDELLVMLDDAQREILESTGSFKEGAVTKASNAYATLNLTSPLTRLHRTTSVLANEVALHHLTTRPKSKLDSTQLKTMEAMGLTEEERKLIGSLFSKKKIDLNKIKKLDIPEAQARTLELKVGNFLNEQADTGVVTVRARGARIMGRHLPKDDPARITRDLFFNLKSSLMTLSHTHQRILNSQMDGFMKANAMDKMNSTANLAAVASALFIFSYVKQKVTEEVVKPMFGDSSETDELTIAKKAMAESMVGGLMVDSALSMAKKQYWSLGMAPVSTAIDLASPVTGDTEKQKEKWKQSIPGQNLWFLEILKANMATDTPNRLK